MGHPTFTPPNAVARKELAGLWSVGFRRYSPRMDSGGTFSPATGAPRPIKMLR
ncbi:MAG: hypothetical protein ACKO2G_06400 [Verrucomicrobiales bacterium]